MKNTGIKLPCCSFGEIVMLLGALKINASVIHSLHTHHVTAMISSSRAAVNQSDRQGSAQDGKRKASEKNLMP